MTSLSVFRDVPPAQKLEGSLLKIYKQDNYSSKMFLAYRGRSQSFQVLRFSSYFRLTANDSVKTLVSCFGNPNKLLLRFVWKVKINPHYIEVE